MIVQLHSVWQNCRQLQKVHAHTSPCAVCVWPPLSERNLWRQPISYSTSQCGKLWETSEFAVESTYVHTSRQSASNLTVSTLLQWCGNVKSLTLGMCIHDCSIKLELNGNPAVHGKLIQMYCRCGDVDGAHALFLSDTQHRNVFVWNIMIRSYAHLGQYQMALDLFDQMLCEGILPDIFTIICVITACSYRAPPTEGRRVHARTLTDTTLTDHLVMNALLNMYSKGKNLEDVRNIFMNMPERNIVTWTVMIDALLHHGCNADALRLLGHMQGEGVCPDGVFFSKIISACSESETLFQGKQLHVSLIEMGCESDIFIRTALVNMYGKCGILEGAHEVFMQPFEQNVALWNSFISLHTQSGLDSDALLHFNRMLQESLLPDRVTLLHCTTACANKSDIIEGRMIHILALNVDSGLDVMLGTNIVYMYGKCGHLESAWQAFHQSHERSVVSWNVMLGVLTQHAEFFKGFHFFGAMQNQGVSPDKVTFMHVLNACLNPSALCVGEQLHSYIIEMGLESDIMVATALVNMYAKCSGIESASRMFEAMPEHNVVSWNAIIIAHVQRGKYRDALQLFRQMQLNKVSPDSSTLSCIVDACVSESLLGEAVLMHMYAVECGFELHNIMGISLLTMYGKRSSMEDAIVVFQMLQTCDVLSWTAILMAYVCSENSVEALRLFFKMELHGLTAVKTTYLVVLEACANLLEPGRGEEIFMSIVKKGLDLDAAVATAVVNLFGKCCSLGAGRRVFDSVPEKDVILWTAMITMYAQNGYGREAACLFAEMQDMGLVPNNVTFVNMLAACSHTGLVEEGYCFLTSMMWDYGMLPLVDHYDCAIDLFGRAGLLDEAEHLINRMPFLPRTVSFMTLLGACRCQTDLERGAQIAKRVYDLSLESCVPHVMFANITLTERSGRALEVAFGMRLNKW